MGDDDQSIYGWRGADVRNMQDFLKDFPGAKLVRLEENYRSTQVVLDAANGVIAENSGRIGKTLTTRRRGGETVTLLAAADERDEAEWVVRELQKRSAAGGLALQRHGGALPHQLAVARAGGGVPAGGHAVPPDRRDQLLRAARGEGPAGLSPADRQSRGRRGVPPRRRGAPARAGRNQPGHARRQARCSGASRCSRLPASPIASRICGPMCARRSAPFAALIDAAGAACGTLPPAEVLEQIIRSHRLRGRAPGRRARKAPTGGKTCASWWPAPPTGRRRSTGG